MSPIFLPRMTATTAAPTLAEVRTRRRSLLTSVTVKSEMKKRLKLSRQLAEEVKRREERRRAGNRMDLFGRVSSNLPLRQDNTDN